MMRIRFEDVPAYGPRYVVYDPKGEAMVHCGSLAEALECAAQAARGVDR